MSNCELIVINAKKKSQFQMPQTLENHIKSLLG